MSAIEEIICSAREAGASDVHLAAGIPPKMRIGGELFSMNCSRLTGADMLDILIGIMPEAVRGRFEESGEYAFSFTLPQGGRCRANAYKQKGTVALAVRLIDSEIPLPEEMGIPEPVAELYQREHGLVLVTGLSGSGRSTTLASLIGKINDSREALILTLENPVEYLHPYKRSMVNQREIGVDSLSWADAIDAAVREDADVIMIGELRDAESATAAVAAAQSGHLVFAAMNAVSAVDAIADIVDLFPPHRQERMRARLAGVLEAVVFQQLNPTADGDGREAAFEILVADEKVRGHIRADRSSALYDAVQHLYQ
ncbi:MAG: PilT/PilU family type 4a pilus ATPase [Lachnospiraceae bacterium]|nr:PilT/PilU family type 4a pilus ATPase [Lachnospiraceae bacterium]